MRLELPKEQLVIPSGAVASTADVIRRLADMEGLGVITTKSIGLSERDGYKEPIMAGVAGSLVNAVGLANPGVYAYLEEIKSSYPLKKVLMTSIFGGTPKEFAELAERVERHTDWIELNLSCPHAEGYGAVIGNRLDLVAEVVLAVRGSTDLPIFVKVVPSQGCAGLVAKRAVDKGADGITAVNTLGPLAFLDETTGRPLLSNVLGGLSGIALKEVAIRCVREVRERVTVPIIGMGGICTRADLDAFRSAGASLFGVGTALAGMNTEAIGAYFRALSSSDPAGERPLMTPPLGYQTLQVRETWGNSAMRVIVLDGVMEAVPGQFIFLWLPGIGEKPFSLASRSPIMVLIKSLGAVSSAFASLEEGSTIFIRGPYGNGYEPSSKVGLVGGGSGVAPIHFIASEFGEMTKAALIGGRNSLELPLYDNLRSYVETRATTEDGSLGAKGLVTDILDPNRLGVKEFFNCGPEPMLVRAAEMECAVADASKIYCAVERYTKCGIGLCGSCAMDGLRICVDGPVFSYNILRNGSDFGRFKRRASGRRVPLNARGHSENQG